MVVVVVVVLVVVVMVIVVGVVVVIVVVVVVVVTVVLFCPWSSSKAYWLSGRWLDSLVFGRVGGWSFGSWSGW